MRNSFDTVTTFLNQQAEANPDAAVAASLQMAAHVRLATPLPIVVHPHAENAALRAKATKFYKLFGEYGNRDRNWVAAKWYAHRAHTGD